MDGQVETTVQRERIETQWHKIDWDAYASQYDLLARNNPSYRANIEDLRALVAGIGLPEDASVCDVGAGTGNFICALAMDLPRARFVHLDADESMNLVASRKYEAASIERVDIHCCSAAEASYPAQSFDMILCVNSLYAIQPRGEFLRRARTWLKPEGVLYVIDFGRRTRMLDWAGYILRHVYRERGLKGCASFLANSLETIRQNRRGSQGQVEGVYWLHSTEEFGEALADAGFSVDRLDTCYRGYCDRAVCRPIGKDVERVDETPSVRRGSEKSMESAVVADY